MIPCWTPDPDRVNRARINAFRVDVSDAVGRDIPDSVALHRFSVERPGDFWEAAWGECGVVGDRGDGPALIVPPAGADMRAARFFPAARLNFAENLLAGADRVGAGEVAIVFRREDGLRRELTWDELRRQVDGLSAFLLSRGIQAGDRVAAWMPNVPETVVAMLAAAKIGAVFTSASPDFGIPALLDRFGQVAPKVLLVADGYWYANKAHHRLGRAAEAVAQLPSLNTVIVHTELDAEVDLELFRVGGANDLRPRVVTLDTAVAEGRAASCRPEPVESVEAAGEFEQFPFDQPLYILYSSGTTGAPKCIIHRAGGILLKHLVEHQLHCDIRPGDRVLYFTTCGWMMWNWLVSCLASGATAVLYDGSPFHPERDVMWDLVEQERVTLFGTSAKYLDAANKAGCRPVATHELGALRTLCSTGSPLPAEGFHYVYEAIKADVHLASISGGTDICGCFVMGDPTSPVYAGEIQGPALGMDVDVWDSEASSLRTLPGLRGELVCKQPFPSLPLGFWGDPDGARYAKAYFSEFADVWAHGDFASWTEHGGLVIHGRSDATLNAGGVRIGTAEIYRQVEQVPGVVEAMAIGQEWDNDTRIVLFIRTGDRIGSIPDLQAQVVQRLREHCSPRHVPARIVVVDDLPRTRSGKLAELAVSDVVHGRPVRSVSGLANPECLELFVDIAELRE